MTFVSALAGGQDLPVLLYDDANGKVGAITAASVQITLPAATTLVTLTSSGNCWIKIGTVGTPPTAVAGAAGNDYLRAGMKLTRMVPQNCVIAVIQDATATGWLAVMPAYDLGATVLPVSTPSLPLDILPGAVLGLSLRKIAAGYAGNSLNVRRQSDNATTDIGFQSNGDWDIPSYHTFIGIESSAGVVKWYDQSGNANHVQNLVTGNTQPLINAPDYPTNNITGIKNDGGSIRNALLAEASDVASLQNIWTNGGFVTFCFSLTGNGESCIISKGTNPNGWLIFLYNNGGTWQCLLYWVAPTAAYTWESNPIALEPTRHVMTVSWNSTTPTVPAIMTLDGVTCGLNAVQNPVGGLSSEAGLLEVINDNSLHTNSEALDGHLFELLVWKSIPSAGIQTALINNLRNYFKTP
jgi:hypothetical protein